MSAIVCGGKRSSFFEDLPSSPPVVSKRIRFSSSSSPVRFSPPSSHSPFNLLARSSFLHHLAALFPDMDKQEAHFNVRSVGFDVKCSTLENNILQLLERALEECGDDLNSAIRSLNELRLGSAENLASTAGKSGTEQSANVHFTAQGLATTNGEVVATVDSSAPKNLPMYGAEWVELFVREMTSASNMDDARARASKVLEVLEKSICANTTAEVAHSFQQENNMLKDQLEALVHENTILKRAVSIQHERQKEFEDRSHELVHLKQMVSQYQEQLRTLEVNNYALTMHLKQAQQSNSIQGRFHPDLF